MRQQSYLNSATKIIGSYTGEGPFAAYLKKYFAANKKYGSKDRKQIASCCYNYFRLGKAPAASSIEEKILAGVFLCEHTPDEFLAFHKPGWNEMIDRSLAEKAAMTGIKTEAVFPWADELSDGIDTSSFASSFFIQPDLFLRIRPGRKNTVLKKLDEAGIYYTMPAEGSIALPNSTKIDSLLELDKEAVIQDLSSQQVLNILKSPVSHIPHAAPVWDCCAASGGKSLLAYDILDGKIALTVSDIRESILMNLRKRFTAAGINKYHSLIADLQTSNPNPDSYRDQTSNVDLIICDAPCTGSGTWSRTPEQLHFFKREMIKEYADKQKQIVSHVIPHLSANGMLIYITCSVFRQENEEVVNFIKEKFHLRLLQMELVRGYDKKADSMFTAAFVKE